MGIFGQTQSGEPVQEVEIAGGGLTARILSWGGVIQDLRLKGHKAPLVLGFPDFESYQAQSLFFGAIVGRNANRIRNGELLIDGTLHLIAPSPPGRHSLHSEPNGLATRNWTFVAVSKDEAVLEIRCPDGNSGFPGNLDVRCTYRLTGKGTLSVVFEAVTDKPTVCNISQHSYFNLEDGGLSDILDHTIRLNADAILSTDKDVCPDGHVLPVAGTDHDFRSARPLRSKAGPQIAYDSMWCLSAARGPMSHTAHVEAPGSGICLDCFTTEAGVQLFAGSAIRPGPAGLTGKPYASFAGFCLETQGWTDSTHFPYFPSNILRPGEVRRQETEYRFTRA